MVQEPELEEGETCCDNDEASIDPDIALSYIGEKVQSILGHLQKDFEGGVSAENLGAKFGGYGSFLPSYQRSPSIWSQPKSPPRVQNSHLHKSPNTCLEEPTPKSVTPSIQRDNASSQTLKTSSHDASVREKATLSSGKVSETFPGKAKLPSSKMGNNPLDQRTLKVRIKVGPERLDRYNAQIHSLGLTSPSSSEETSHDESDELLPETHETPNESPAYMLKMMTSFSISDGLLLSPLSEDLLNLTRKREYRVQSECEAAPKNSAISIKILNNDALGGKKTKAVDKRGKSDNSIDNLEDLNVCEQKTLHDDNVACNMQPFHNLKCKSLPDENALSNMRKDCKTKGQDFSGGLLKDVSSEHTKHLESRCTSLEKIEEHKASISQKEVSFDHGQVGKNGVRGSHPSLKSHSEGERVDPTLRTGLYSTSSGYNESNPPPVGIFSIEGGKKSKVSKSGGKKALKSDSIRDSDCAAPKKKTSGMKEAHRHHLGVKDVVQTRLEQMENRKHSLDSPKNTNLDDVEAKSALAEKVKERSISKKHIDRVQPHSNTVVPPSVAVGSKEGIVSGLEQTGGVPVLIQEDWVMCDRCGKWRLLPYGTKAEQLPDKWLCSMMDWLPGLNHCDVSQDETTAAVEARNQVPIPENQNNFQAHANGVATISNDFSQNHQKFPSDLMKQKLKKRQTKVGTNPLRSNSQMRILQPELENGSLKDVKPSLARVNFTNQIDMVKLNKRKGEHVVGADANPGKRIKQESSEYLQEKGQMKRIKSKDALPVLENDQNSCGNLGVNGHNVTLGLPSKVDMKNAKIKSVKKEVISGGLGNIQIDVKHETVKQNIPRNDLPRMEICNGGQVTAKKIKLKDYAYSQERKVSQTEGDDFHRDKKLKVSHNENDFRSGDISKTRSVELGAKEYPLNRSVEKEQQVKKHRAKMSCTIQDIVELKKDLEYEQPSMAATSSSSKVSDSRKNRVSRMEVKGSPEESVSSSPMRIETTGKVDIRFNEVDAVSSVKKQDLNESLEFRRRTSGMDNGSEMLNLKKRPKKETVVDNTRHPLSNDFSLKSAKNSPSVGKSSVRKSKDRNEKQPIQRERDKNALESSDPSTKQNLKQDPSKNSIEHSSAQVEPWNGKVRLGLRQVDKQGAVLPRKRASGSMASLKRSPTDSRLHDASVHGEKPKIQKDGNENLINTEPEKQLAPGASLRNKNVSGATASTALKEAEDVLKEAEELRSHADLIKNSGFGSESNYVCFEAALKFLHGASLLEACNAEHSKQMEMSPMQMYGAAAQLCKICASAYEKGHELAFAALAYKCMEVAYMRVVYCKSSSTNRFCQDLQSSLQMVPQGESPSSSASDVDNLNNLAMVDKATLSKGSASHAANHVIVPRNRSNFIRLLDFTKDVNSAMEAAKKTQETFAAAHVELKKSQKKDAIVSIKRVADFSFQDVEELIRLVWITINSINHRGE